jgi:RNA polymerase sigma-70 factor (ECF subfamily)
MIALMEDRTDRSETSRSIKQAVRGDQRAIGELRDRFRERLRCMVAVRLDRRLQGRIDPFDVIQDAYVDAARRLPGYHQDPPMSFFLWLRFLTGQRLVDEHRRHRCRGR